MRNRTLKYGVSVITLNGKTCLTFRKKLPQRFQSPSNRSCQKMNVNRSNTGKPQASRHTKTIFKVAFFGIREHLRMYSIPFRFFIPRLKKTHRMRSRTPEWRMPTIFLVTTASCLRVSPIRWPRMQTSKKLHFMIRNQASY